LYALLHNIMSTIFSLDYTKLYLGNSAKEDDPLLGFRDSGVIGLRRVPDQVDANLAGSTGGGAGRSRGILRKQKQRGEYPSRKKRHAFCEK